MGNGLISLDPVVNINRPVDHTPEDIRKERMLNKDESGMENSYETAKIG